MRVKWIIAGVFGTSAIAAASPSLQFSTVINDGDPIAGDTFAEAGQVVVGDGGVVGMVAQLNNSGNPIVIYSTPAAGNTWNSQTVVEGNTPTTVNGMTPNQQFIEFDNLALTSNPVGGTRLSFAAANPADQVGILQWDDNSNVTSLGDVAFEGDGKGYSKIGDDGTDSGEGTLEMQVNASGQVLFPAVVSSKQSLIRGDVSSLTTVFTSGSPTISDPGSRVGLGANNTSASLLNSGSSAAIFTIPASGGIPAQITGSGAPVSFEPLIGYSSSTGAVIVVNGSGAGKENVEYVPAGGGAPLPVAVSEFTPGSNPLSPPVGEITPNGKIAMYIPDTVAGDTIQYGNTGSGNPQAAVIASVAPASGPVPATAVALDPSATSLDIEGLQDPSGGTPWVPQVNQNGTMVFNAEIGTSPSDEKMALLDWQVGAASPTVVLAVGDDLTIGGQPVEIDDFVLNNLDNENDYFKNALSDDNHLAISVEYTDLSGADAGDIGTAVIMTQVPEPATLGLVSIAGFGLLARRKRR